MAKTAAPRDYVEVIDDGRLVVRSYHQDDPPPSWLAVRHESEGRGFYPGWTFHRLYVARDGGTFPYIDWSFTVNDAQVAAGNLAELASDRGISVGVLTGLLRAAQQGRSATHKN